METRVTHSIAAAGLGLCSATMSAQVRNGRDQLAGT
jgi:hypothetical protein